MRMEVRRLPLILQNRISIELEGDDLSAEFPSIVLARLREIYEENITSTSQLLPRLPGDRGNMLECYLSSNTYKAGALVLVAGIEGNRVSFDCISNQQR
jgi:hypothetical protein